MRFIHPCSIDKSPCEIVDLFAEDLERRLREATTNDEDYELELRNTHDCLNYYLPCQICRGAGLSANNLRGLRLGKLQRTILLDIYIQGKIERPENRSPIESMSVAVSKLRKAGLLYEQDRTGRLAFLQLSPLGNAVMKEIEHTLRSKHRIRWNEVISEVVRTLCSKKVSVTLVLHKDIKSGLESLRKRLSHYDYSYAVLKAYRDKYSRLSRVLVSLEHASRPFEISE